ncbi:MULTISPECIES: exopolysaccharide biosynthesis polyprenyl glycosylphosphotransferase [Liquorilactobacillus]|uniref:Bacterial sugar transferase n=2 Tax=Liquorilactobacillus satsumensis TaxID=259059 RepID=A0A0R1UZB9_9LACO|nr:exopolysaccharide biosynthesis polyprenyl glycosylphosphotransferase [Liquorilactobacillus satsumensis]KRL98681.1 bacterial sugar transferase [Liquorilactobacillus satsumensis DSM 16230 = JCM 12392]
MSGKIKSNSSGFIANTAFRAMKIGNLLLMTLSFGYVWYSFYADKVIAPFYDRGNLLILVTFMLVYFLYGRTYDAFAVDILKFSELVYSQCLSLIATNCIMYLIIAVLSRRIVSAIPLISCLLVQVGLSFIWSLFARRIYIRLFPIKKTLVIYDKHSEIGSMVAKHELKNIFSVKKNVTVQELGENVTSKFEQIDAVFLINIHSHVRNQIIKECVAQDISVYILPRIGDVMMSGAEKMHILHLPILKIARYNPKPEYIIIKRLFDFCAAGVLFILTLPVFLLVALAIKSTDQGPIFYKQCRLTKDGKKFNVLKFRSMRVDAEKDGIARLSTGDKDTRITPVGKFLRKVRLDELPQLLNIIKGDMSVVGPRPERPEIARQYEKTLPEFALRLQAKAGLTGYAQVYGKYNTTPYNKLEMDLMYIAKPSLLADLKIIFATIKILFMSESTEGVSEESTTAEKISKN